MPQNQELCFTDGAVHVLPTVRLLLGHTGRSPALCLVKARRMGMPPALAVQ